MKLINLVKRLMQIADHTEVKQAVSDELADQLKQAAFKRIFNQPRFAVRDGLNEYDEDYRFFVPRGHLITAEMRESLLRSLNTETETTEAVSEIEVTEDHCNDARETDQTG